jgi:hypothetical protein
MARSSRKKTRIANETHIAISAAQAGAAQDAELVIRFVRFMDQQFGPGRWEHAPGEPPDNAAIRALALAAFKAGAGVD